jgi:hypothetical protein
LFYILGKNISIVKSELSLKEQAGSLLKSGSYRN